MLTPYDPTGQHCSNRLFEWMSGIGLFFYGLHVIVLPASMASSRYASVLLIFTPLQFGLCCAVVGAARVVSLYKNGTWFVWGPRLRVFLALAAAGLYGQIAVALLQWQSPGMWVYFAVVGAELRTIWRAKREANAQ